MQTHPRRSNAHIGRFNTSIIALGLTLVIATVCQSQVARTTSINAGPPRTITGTVYDPSGAPAPGVAVLLAQSGVANSPPKSDANGRYSLNWISLPSNASRTAGSGYSLVARDVEHNFAVAQTVDETTTNLDLHLRTGLAISVMIQAADGKPITNATANLAIVSAANAVAVSVSRTRINADAQGRIEIAALPRGSSFYMDTSAAGYGAARLPGIGEAETQKDRLELPAVVLKAANLKLAGRVLAADGKPAVAARVSVAGIGQPATNTESDATGHFTLNVCEGPVNVSAILQGAFGRAQAVGGATNVVLHLGATNSLISTVRTNSPAAASGGPRITGTAFDPSGLPSPGVAISLLPVGGPNQDIFTDESGRFAVPWQAMSVGTNSTRVKLEYLLMGRDLKRNFASTLSIDEKTTNVELHLEAGITVSGSVLDTDGDPLKTATVRLSMSTPGISSTLGRQPDKVDDQGGFKFSALPPGRGYGVAVTAPGFGSVSMPFSAPQSIVPSIQLQPIRLKPADQRLEGQVVGPDGNAVPGALVRATGSGQPADSVRTDASGHFAMKVCEGPVRVSATEVAGDGNNQHRSGTVQAQAGDLDVVVKLSATNGVPAGVSRQRANPGNPPTN